ncbi:ECF RNA polymerase sigma factor SigR [compost metagenome]
MSSSEEFNRELLSEYPNLFRFAMSMTRNRAEAEDLMQETVLLALEKHDEYELGTSMKAWLFRLQVLIDKNNRRRVVRQRLLSDGNIEDPETAAVPPSQLDRLMFKEAAHAVETLPIDQKQALYLVVYDGKSYDDAADILACSSGTVKSRVSRARARIAEIIQYEHLDKNTERELAR